MTNRFHEAICFAGKRHAGQVRKGSSVPYLVHPMEVMGILMENGCSEDVIIAGILHDVIEDTCDDNDVIRNIVREGIRTRFGDTVLAIVNSESEDKSKSWQERKQATIDGIPTDSLDTQMVCCADKLSNILTIQADLAKVGERVWTRFSAPKERVAWYYTSIVDALEPTLHETAMWKELKAAVSNVFPN